MKTPPVLLSLLPAILLAGCPSFTDAMDDDDAGDDDAGLSDPHLDVVASLISAHAVPSALPEESPEVVLILEAEITNDGPDDVGDFGVQAATLRRVADDTAVVTAAMEPTVAWDGVVPAGETVTIQFESSTGLPAPPEGGYPCGEDVYLDLVLTYAAGWTEDLDSSPVGFTCYD